MMPVRLKEWRQHLGITQLELAAKSGVGWATIKRLERVEKIQAAQPSTRRKLAEALGITPVDLIGYPPGFEGKGIT
jgi:transcriptional regulator with XRE-family HTH domain